ncbi:MAG: helix-turn-helix transcriptional regulator [Paracoccaceae bacterium]
MENISTCRAAYLIPFIDVLRDIGTPVERELERGHLPTEVEESPEDFVSNNLAMEFLARNERREGIGDLGWLWAQRFSASNMSADLMGALSNLPTIHARLHGLSKLIKLEDSTARVGIIKTDDSAEIFCDGAPPDGIDGIPISEWTQVTVLIEVIRTILGQTWTPDEIRFKSDFKVCDAARMANPNTRFINRANHTSIVVPSSMLATAKTTCVLSEANEFNCLSDHDTIDKITRLLRPYLRAAAPNINLFAEVAGTSPRTLQRKLSQYGTSYSELIDTTRFEMATEMLEDPNTHLIDVAMTLGYENQSNFGRSFRRIAGTSPGKYRRDLLSQENAA